MKKFLVRLSIYLFILSALILLTNELYFYRIYTRNLGTMGTKRNDSAFIKDVTEAINICNFGSSHGYYGFDYEDVNDYICFNFGLPSQSLRYDYKILQNYRNNINPGAYVFIVISYFSFFGVPEVQETNFDSKNTRYYKFLRSDLIDKYSLKSDIASHYLSFMGYNDIVSFIVSAFLSEGDLWTHIANPATSQQHAEGRYQSHVASRLGQDGKRIYKTEAVNALYDIIDLCRELEATPIMITTPYLHEYPDAVKKNDPEFFDDFYSIISEVSSKTGVKYYDYSHDERFSDNYTLFINTDHLNREGARIFTNMLLREVLGHML